MKHPIILLTAVLFFIWILPLGFFIKPSQEKSACNGQRALCMCRAPFGKVQTTPIDGNFKASSSSNKETNASGGAGHYYLAAHLSILNNLAMRTFNDSLFSAYRNPFFRSIDHIPKF